MKNLKLRIYFLGGTKRAVGLYKKILDRNDIEIVFSIFMQGYQEEHIFCESLIDLASKYNKDFVVSEIITKDIVDKINRDFPDVVICGGIWRNLIPEDFLNASKYGCLALHGSGLPKYRGWAGINWYIINGEDEYVMRMFRLGNGLDNGPLILRSDKTFMEYKIPLNNTKHIHEILDDIYDVHNKAYMELFDLLISDNIFFIDQNEDDATYTCSRTADDGEIDWKNSTKNIFNFIRAQSKPYAGAYTFFNGDKVVLWKVLPRYDYVNYIGRIPGKVVTRSKERNSVVVLTGDGGIEIFDAVVVETGEVNVLKIFNSVKKRCQSEIEAFISKYKVVK
ncbi:methionyl-tRNA formyltransferase [Campylobacter concisus]|jgi:methionyl-tRNA formyltransferase|uniref:Formyltransferase domain-containing protein n=1 Tax=Campylobacter concisus (strain 13826) TaxID=360104 RepID=A7ZF09_CAMC1|nr:formyltransferase family protein [Campylobacter concisus]EAT99356.1 formyltransferase domain-containing protein [Campylobacter concisus 13826]